MKPGMLGLNRSLLSRFAINCRYLLASQRFQRDCFLYGNAHIWRTEIQGITSSYNAYSWCCGPKKYKTQLWTVDELQFIMRFVTKISADFAESPWIVLMHFPHRSSGNLVHPGIYLFSETWEEKHGKTMEFPLSLLRYMRGHIVSGIGCFCEIQYGSEVQTSWLTRSKARGELNCDHRGTVWNWGMGGRSPNQCGFGTWKFMGKNVKLMVKHHVPYFLNGTLWFWFLGVEPDSVYTPRHWHCLKCLFLRWWLFPNQLLLYISICSGI